MKISRVRNWNELNDTLFQDTWYRPHGRFRGPFVFRGMSDAAWDLQTSLMRLAGQFERLEGSLLRNFRKYGHSKTVSGDSFWHWLVVAQHHGLPTRLLDWTYSPHIATHFATEDTDQFHRDGVIWAVDMTAVHERLPEHLQDVLRTEQAFVFTTAMLDTYATSLSGFDDRFGSGGALFLEPPALDDRIVNQAAFLSVMSPSSARMDEWLEESGPELCRKIIIPASVKLEIRDKLDMMNITERMIYPGLDGLSKWLKRYYSPLNIAQVIYHNDDGDSKRIAVVLEVLDGVLDVQLFLPDGTQDVRSRIHSAENGEWVDLERNCPVTVRLRSPGVLTDGLRTFLRGLRSGRERDSGPVG
jgi:hypothetical protein